MTKWTNICVRPGAICVLLARVLAFSVCLATASNAQTGGRERPVAVRGRVVDDVTRQGIAGALVSVVNDSRILASETTDSAGYLNLLVPSSTSLSIDVRRLGYQPTSMRIGADELSTPLTIAMHLAPQTLGEVAVVSTGWRSSRLAGFEERARLKAGGTYLTREDIDMWHPRRASDLMRRVTGVQLWDSSGTLLAISGRGYKVDGLRGNAMANCVMRVGVDGQVKEWGFAMDLIDPESIHGIEIYRGPGSIPAQFNGLRTDSACGLIMLWTRSGH